MLLASMNGGSVANSWILDSGCTYHMCPHKEWFYTYQPCDVGTVLMGNDASYKVIRIGTVKIKMYDGIVRILGNVQHIPKLKKNLISLGTLDSLVVSSNGKRDGITQEESDLGIVAKGCSQKESIDYNEIFSLVIKHTSIRVILSIVAM
ncbi:hypothetical protein UlMin_041403 [Ulmus minor]